MKDLLTEIRLFPPKNKEQTKVLASGYFVAGGKIKVRCAIVRNKHGNPWLVLPYHEDGQGNTFNDVEGINREAGDALKEALLAEYAKMSKESDEFDQSATALPDEEKSWDQ